MGIDRIGKGASSAPPEPASGPERTRMPIEGASDPAKTFEVRPPHAAAPNAAAPAAPAAAGPLDRLRAGEIDLDRYLDLKVNEASAHLSGLRAQEMEGLRSLLREQLASDPALVDLVQQATGQRPTPKE